MSVRLLTFDLDDTLWPVEEVIHRAERLAHDWLEERYPHVARDWSPERLRALRGELVRGNPDFLHNLTALRRASLEHCFMQSGHREAEARILAQQAFEIFHEARNQVNLFPEARTVLEALASRFALGALTNGNADLRRIGLHDLFAFHHSAESVGRRKPEPDMFLAALRSAGVRACDAVHMGDHPEEDVQAALTHGFGAIWANLLEREWPSHLPVPSHRVQTWTELPDLLDRIDG